MAKQGSITKSLLKATKIDDLQDGEDQNQFLTRLYEAAHELDQDVWEALPELVQDWVNAATTAGNEDELLPDPDTFVSPKVTAKEEDASDDDDSDGDADDDDAGDDDEDSDEPSEDEEESNEVNETGEADMEAHTETEPVKKPKKASKAPAKKAAAPKKETKAAAKPAKKTPTPRSGGTGAQTQIKLLMLKDPNISTEDLIDRLAKKGMKPTKVAVTSIRSGMRHTLRVMAEAGVLHSSIKFGA